MTSGTYTLELTSNDSQIETRHEIPAQTIRLKSYVVRFANVADAAANGKLRIVFPNLDTKYLIDNFPNMTSIPIFLNYGVLETFVSHTDRAVVINQPLPENFNVLVFDSVGVLATFDSIDLSFELSLGADK